MNVETVIEGEADSIVSNVTSFSPLVQQKQAIADKNDICYTHLLVNYVTYSETRKHRRALPSS